MQNRGAAESAVRPDASKRGLSRERSEFDVPGATQAIDSSLAL
jgi:hypothetical protein